MIVQELQEWANALPLEAHVQFMLDEVAKAKGFADYRPPDEKGDGWVPLEGRHLRIIIEHPDRRPAEVADRLLK